MVFFVLKASYSVEHPFILWVLQLLNMTNTNLHTDDAVITALNTVLTQLDNDNT